MATVVEVVVGTFSGRSVQSVVFRLYFATAISENGIVQNSCLVRQLVAVVSRKQ